MSDLKESFIPGFAMGLTRALVSHPFEILKIKSQLGITKAVPLLKGLHYSLLASGIERGIQFGLYDFFKRKDDSNLVSSLKASSLSTCIGVPYNFYIVNRSVVNRSFCFSPANLAKTVPLEYSRAFIGSSLFLFTYNSLRDADKAPWWAAFGGTTAAWSVTYPIDNVRNQIISGRNKFSLAGLYKGIHYPVFRSIPSSIVGMYVYEAVKSAISADARAV